MTVVIILPFLLISSILSQQYDVIVVGSGIGGLTAASTLSERHSVLVLEKNFKFGGSLQTFSRSVDNRTYLLDVGLHVLANCSGSLGLFNYVTQTPLEFENVGDVVHVVVIGSKRYPVRPPLFSQWVVDLSEQFPSEKDALQKIKDTVINVKEDDPTLLMEFLDEMTDNEALKTTLFHHTMYFGLPFKMSLFAYRSLCNFVSGGLFYPYGGSKKIVDSAIAKIEANGGVLKKNCGAKKLILDEIMPTVVALEDTDKQTYYTSNVAAATSVFDVFNTEFIDNNVLQDLGYIEDMKKVKPSYGMIMVWLCINAKPEDLDAGKSSIFYFPQKEAWKTYQLYLNQPVPFRDYDIPWFMFSSSAKDPEYTKGLTAIHILLPASFNWFSQWENSTVGRRPQQYYELKQKFEDKAIEAAKKIYPKISDQLIDVVVTGSPLTSDDFLFHHYGSAFGINHDEKQSWIGTRTKIDGLFLSGQDAKGSGILPAMLAGMNVTANIGQKKKLN